MGSKRVSAALFAATVALWAVRGHAEGLGKPAGVCQQAIGKAGQKFKKTKLKAWRKCLDGILLGNGCDAAVRDQAIANAEANFVAHVGKRCDPASLFSAPPDGVGFRPTCDLEPGPLEAAEEACRALPVTDAASLARCLVCWKQVELYELLKILYPCLEGTVPEGSDLDCGTPPAACPTDKAGIKCTRVIAQAGIGFSLAEEKALERCVDAVNRGRIPGPCPDAVARKKIVAAEAKKRSQIQKCTALPPWWDVCPEDSALPCDQAIGSVADVAECVDRAGDEVAAELVCQQYPAAVAAGVPCPPGEAELFGFELTFGLDPTRLDDTSFAATETLPPDQGTFGPTNDHANVPPTMTVLATLAYQSQTGPRQIVRSLDVDNATRQVLSAGQPVARVSDIFGMISDAAHGTGFLTVSAPGVAIQILVVGPGVFAQAADAQYHTDTGAKKENKIVMSASSGHGTMTVAQECQQLRDSGKFSDDQLRDLKDHRKGGDGTKTGDTTDTYDCHGLTFADGKSWINNSEVAKILNDNGYKKIDPTNGGTAIVGDVCVFRGPDKACNGGRRSGGDCSTDNDCPPDGKCEQQIIHTETVTAVDGNGVPTRSRGKWGDGGEYEHPVGVDPYDETSVEYWHSDRRNGNTLQKGALGC